MNPFDGLYKAVRDAMLLSREVELLAEDVKETARDVRDHEKRLSRLEGALDYAARASGGGPRLIGPE